MGQQSSSSIQQGSAQALKMTYQNLLIPDRLWQCYSNETYVFCILLHGVSSLCCVTIKYQNKLKGFRTNQKSLLSVTLNWLASLVNQVLRLWLECSCLNATHWKAVSVLFIQETVQCICNQFLNVILLIKTSCSYVPFLRLGRLWNKF